jgi:hypothetical protein
VAEAEAVACRCGRLALLQCTRCRHEMAEHVEVPSAYLAAMEVRAGET